MQYYYYYYVCVGVWVCGCVGVRVCVCGCVGVWVCGCVGVWVRLFRHSNRGLITKGTIGSPVGKRPPFAKRVQNI